MAEQKLFVEEDAKRFCSEGHGDFNALLTELAAFPTCRRTQVENLCKYTKWTYDVTGYGLATDCRTPTEDGTSGYGPNFGSYDLKKGVYKEEGFYYDGKYAFVLTRSGNPLACISFDLDGPGSVKIKQIQGLKGKRKDLVPLFWERYLVAHVENWTRAHGGEQLKLAAARSLLWKKGREGRLARRYDQTAEALNFSKISDFEYQKRIA